jgi:hypothetical protein
LDLRYDRRGNAVGDARASSVAASCIRGSRCKLAYSDKNDHPFRRNVIKKSVFEQEPGETPQGLAPKRESPRPPADQGVGTSDHRSSEWVITMRRNTQQAGPWSDPTQIRTRVRSQRAGLRALGSSVLRPVLTRPMPGELRAMLRLEALPETPGCDEAGRPAKARSPLSRIEAAPEYAKLGPRCSVTGSCTETLPFRDRRVAR